MPLDTARLLFVNIYFPPEVTGIAPYNAGLTAHLAARGARVTMITGMPHFPQWRTWAHYRYRLRAREGYDGVEVRRVRHFSAAGDSVLGRALYEGTFLTQALSTVVRPRPDAVLAVIPNLTSGVAAALHARRFGVPFGVLVQDLTGSATTQSGMPGGQKAAGPVRAVEGWILRRAARVAVISDAFRGPAEEAGARPERIVTLPNWSHVRLPSGDRTDVRRRMGWSTDVDVVLHAGNMGFKQCLDNVLHAARLSSSHERRMHFVFMGDGSQRARLESEAQGMANVQFLDLQPADQFMDVLGAADVLLLNERATVRNMSLPSKITSYFCAGRPVVAAVPPEGSTAQELARSGGAHLVAPENPEALVKGLIAVVADSRLSADLVGSARAYVETTLDKHLVLRQAEQFVEDVLAGAPGTPPRPA
ncbi:MAG: glycosyltransferase [Actinomycetota bacterium]|nr:glycosyltransferase [Actinomycetota bacterium]